MTQLPLLFLPDVVILPGMVVPIELDEAAQAAVDAARATESHELLVAPRLDDRYASYGVVATIEKVGRFSRGGPAAVLRAGVRAEIGSGVTGPGAALWVEATPVEPTRADRAHARARERVPEARRRGAPAARGLADHRPVRVVDRPRADRRHGRLGAVPQQRAQARAAGDARRRAAPRAAHRVDPRAPRRGRDQRQDRHRRPRGHGEVAAGVPAAPAAQRDPQGARRGRARRRGRLPGAGRGGRGAGRGPGGAAARGRQARALQRPEPGGGVDPHLARHRARAPVEHHDRRLHRHRRGARRARRRPPRPGRREGPDRRVPRRPRPTGLAWPRRRRRTRQRCRDPARGPSRRRQDVARRVRRAHARPEVRARRPRRRARRGGDPRPPAHVRRCAAGPHRPRDQGGRLDEPGRAAGRGRQGRLGLPGRPGGRAARGARPGAEPHVPRPLPRARPGPVRRAVHRHRQRGGDDPAGTARPDGAGDARRLHRGRQGRDRSRLPGAPAARAGGAGRRGGDRDRRGAARDRREPHPRGRRTPARADHREGVPQGGDEARRRYAGPDHGRPAGAP